MLLEWKNQDPYVYPTWMFWLQWLSLPHWIELLFAAIGISLLYYGIRIEEKGILEEGGK